MLFKTHFWDDFIARRFTALCAACPRAEIWVAVDETNGAVSSIPHDRVFRTTDERMHALGFPRQPKEVLNWYNNDYPLLAFFVEHGDYDFYIAVEFDVGVFCDLDTMAEDAWRRDIDLIGHQLLQPIERWPWSYTMESVWTQEQMSHQLLCIAGYSPRAVGHLLTLRRQHAVEFAAGRFPHWPFCDLASS